MSSLRRERWKPVAGWEGWYEVSDRGRIRRIASASGTRAGLELKPNYKRGYPCVGLQRNNGPRIWRSVHRLLLLTFVGPCPNGMESRHLNGQRDDCRLDNLCWGTKKQNMADKRLHGTMARFPGEENGNARLTKKDVRKIRLMCKRGSTQRFIAKKFGISFQHVSDIVLRKRWVHI